MSLPSFTQILDTLHQTLDPSSILDDDAKHAFLDNDDIMGGAETSKTGPSMTAATQPVTGSRSALLEGPTTVSVSTRDSRSVAPLVKDPSLSRTTAIRPRDAHASVKTAPSQRTAVSVKTATSSVRTAPTVKTSQYRKTTQYEYVKTTDVTAGTSTTTATSSSTDTTGPSVTATPSLTTAPSMTTAPSFGTSRSMTSSDHISSAAAASSTASSFFRGGSVAPPPVKTVRTCRSSLACPPSTPTPRAGASTDGLYNNDLTSSVSNLPSNKIAFSSFGRRFGGPDGDRPRRVREPQDEREESRSNDNNRNNNNNIESSNNSNREEIIDLSDFDPQGPYDGLLERVAVMTVQMERMLSEFEQMRSENAVLLENLHMAGDSAQMQIDYCRDEEGSVERY